MERIDKKDIRRSVIAGSWYPGTEASLKATVDEFLTNVEEGQIPGRLVGLIAPHAGYVYSGQVAAYAYKLLQDTPFDVVAVISPVHRFYAGTFAVTAQRYYETPLGLVEIDRTMVEALDRKVSLNQVRRDDEHSLEIQLPFLQRVLGPFKLLPIMMGDQEFSSCQVLGQALAEVLDSRNALLVASTDLSHFHDYDTAVRLDQMVIDRISAFDPEGLARDLASRTCEACGGGPVVAVMLAAKALGADETRILKYANSGDVTGDRFRVVGYLAGAIYQRSQT